MTARDVTLVFQPEGVRLPADLSSLGRFRRWARSDGFPERGRIDWLDGEVLIDMSPEDLNTHGSPKSAIAAVLFLLIQRARLGLVYVDRARLSDARAGLSSEPDVTVVLYESVRTGRVRLVRKATHEEGRFVEIEGAADLVVECVSDSSEDKDNLRLPKLYFAAGVREYWLVDARSDRLAFTLFVRGQRKFRRVPPDRNGFVRSAVLDRPVRLVRLHEEEGLVAYDLET